MSERQAKAPTMSALLPSRLVPEDMLSEWQGPNLPNTKNYAPPPDSMRGRMGDVLMQGIAALGGFTGLPMSDEGDRAALLGELLAAGMPLVGGVKQLAKLVGAKNKVAKGIKAFHGSPYDFDQFSLSKIGTGDGAQAYGHGLYFAENEAVAKEIRDQLSTVDTLVNGQKVWPVDPNFEAAASISANGYDTALAMAERNAKETFSTADGQRHAAELAKKIRALKGAPVAVKQSGKMYEVNINADPEDFLDWDAPLSQQQQGRLSGVLPSGEVSIPPEGLDMSGGGRVFPNHQSQTANKPYPYILKSGDANFGLSEADVKRMLGSGGTGNQAYTRLTATLGSQDKATEALKQAGIPGIKYLDGVSRGGPKNPIKGGYYDQQPRTRNYVVFDDKLISIVKKYGIAAALSAGAINELEAQQLQAQGYQ